MFFFFVYPKLDARNPLNEVQAEQKFNHQYLWLHLILLQYLICKKKKKGVILQIWLRVANDLQI